MRKKRFLSLYLRWSKTKKEEKNWKIKESKVSIAIKTVIKETSSEELNQQPPVETSVDIPQPEEQAVVISKEEIPVVEEKTPKTTRKRTPRKSKKAEEAAKQLEITKEAAEQVSAEVVVQNDSEQPAKTTKKPTKTRKASRARKKTVDSTDAQNVTV